MDMGGSAQNTLLTCIGLSDRYELILVYGLSRESRMTETERQTVERKLAEARNKGVKCFPLPHLIRRIDPFQDFRAFIALYKLMRKEQPDIVHTHSSKAGLLGRWAAWITGVPFIVHTPHGHVFFGHFGPVLSRIFLLAEKITALITNCMIALTEGEKNDYVEFSIIQPASINIIHSGVDIGRYKNTQVNIEKKKVSLGLKPNNLVVGTVGWLLPIKGPMILLKALSRIWQDRSDVELVYVGKGDLEWDLKQQAIKMGVSEQVKFLGWRDDVHEIIPVFDLFVLPSLNEGMGRVLVEAMAAGKPVVGSNVGGIPDLIKNGQNGFLFESGDISGLSAVIEKLLLDKNMRHVMGKRGQSIAQDFSEAKMVEKIDALYASLLN